MKTRLMLRCMAIFLSIVSATQALGSGSVSMALNGKEIALSLVSCTSEPSYFLIDASGESASLSVVGSPTGDAPYTTIDLFFTEPGKDLRASLSTGAIQLEGGQFAYTGDIGVSDGSNRFLTLVVTGCG